MDSPIVLRSNRRTACSAMLGALGAAAMGCKPAKARRPNILLALADDLSWIHTGAMGATTLRTPNFDRIAQEGALFTNSFAASPSCTPSRSAILTGRQIWQVEEGGLLHSAYPPKYPPFTFHLAEAGYHVGYTGKSGGPGAWNEVGLGRPPVGKEDNHRNVQHRS